MILLLVIVLLMFVSMKQSVLLKVFLNQETKRSNKVAFSRVVYMDNSVMFPFNKVLDAMHVLFGEDCVCQVEQFTINEMDCRTL